ncbi:hypothetical protein ACWGJ9_09200 [Curtobacterium citreum]
MLVFTPTDWVINAVIGAAWVAAIIWVAVEDRRSARRWDTLQAGVRQSLGVRTPQEHAVVAAHHAAVAAAAYERAKAAVAVAEQAYANMLRITRTSR